jgi:PKD repeat protein
LIATGVTKQTVKPSAEFSSNSRIVCVGQPVTFYDLSCLGTVTSRVWTFEGATQTTFTNESPSVTYSKPGVYPVKLRAISPYGADEISKTDYITVYPAEGQEGPNTEEGFENGDPVKTSGYVHLSDLPYRFNRTNIASFTGSYSFVAPITSQTPAGVVYSFQTPSFNIASMPAGQSPKFTFYASYAQPNANTSETLKLFISTDCGGTWNQVYQRSGTGLSYSVNAPYSSNWVPSEDAHWRRHGLASLASLGYGDAISAIFRIDVLSDGGNPVYIDNINMGNWYAGFNQLKADEIKIKVFPNPVESESQLSLDIKRKGVYANIGLYDMAGREVMHIFNGTLEKGLNNWNLTGDHLQNGLYMVRVNTSMGTYTQTLIYGVK